MGFNSGFKGLIYSHAEPIFLGSMRCIHWYVVTDVSEDEGTSKYQALQSLEASVTMVSTNRHSITFQKSSIFSYTAVRSSNLAQPVQTLIPKLPNMTCGELLMQITPQNMSLAVCSITF